MDEKGILLGIAARSKVVVPRNLLWKSVQQPGNREFVSILECFSAAGHALEPFVIWKAKQHQETWYNRGNFEQWSFALSNRGWTDRDLALSWIKVFDQQTRLEDPDQWRMLLIDNHDSHVTWQFIEYAIDHRICLCALPPHSTDQLQPADVGLFGPLQHYYGLEVDDACRGGVTGIGKNRFIEMYERARTTAFTRENVLSAWAAAGLYPYDPERVIAKIRNPSTNNSERPQTPTDQPITAELDNLDHLVQNLRTPQNVQQTEQLAFAIEKQTDILLRSPTAERHIRRLRDLQLKLSVATIRAQTNAELHEFLNKSVQKTHKDKTQSQRMLSKGRVLNGNELWRIKAEQLRKDEDARMRANRRALEEGEYQPELEVANPHEFALDPSARGLNLDDPDMFNNCHVLEIYRQPAKDLGIQEWNGRQGANCTYQTHSDCILM